ncbi:DUF4179 domain-containing protein [Cohnella lubricantis]|uniref:DUF4179 domain-containing protein n=1 Tax=Cohnella lubricantis TaxID=2163172 RepID=A0A841TGL8_9BACL|nr:DUF4179 domain-containing protein [Cohnella lubricantis]MBB6679079.1 DUF4179 domain-containing protein [Cohnella lubricantis]MBP2118534.1 hypothetical protein [Cohnella lubricantis]
MLEPTEAQRSLDQRMNDAILAGIRQAKERKRLTRSRNRLRSAAAIACCFALIACLFTIRISPVFASMLRDIPGLEKFVDMIDRSADRGLQLAADNDLMQPIGLSDEHDGGKFTIEGIIADQSRMVVFYELESETAKRLNLWRTELSDGNGQHLSASTGVANENPIQELGRSVVRGTIDITLAGDRQWPDQVRLEIGTMEESSAALPEPDQNVTDYSTKDPDFGPREGNGPDYTVMFPIDRKKFESLIREYPIDQTIEAEGQRITFERAVVSPLRIALYLHYAEDNTKKIFDTGDIHLVDENGEQWRTIGGSYRMDHPILYFESNYFHKPKHLTIEGGWLRALDKSKLQVMIDTEKQQIVQAPDDNLELLDVARRGSYTMLTVGVRSDVPDDHMMYSVLSSQFTDASGAKYEMGGDGGNLEESWNDANNPAKSYTSYYLKNRAYHQPLTFEITQYPAYIRQPYRIPIW